MKWEMALVTAFLLLAYVGCTTAAPDSGNSSSSGPSPIIRTFGIYTQTKPLYFMCDVEFTNCNYGGKYGQWGTGSILADDTIDKPSVSGCLKSTVFTIANNDGGVYWMFCSNQTGSLIPVDVDMSLYANGYLHFWIKAPTDLQIKLESVNKTIVAVQWLSTYITIDGSIWQEVNIPMTDFSAAANFTNLNIVLGLHNGKGTFKLAELYYSDK